MDTQERPRLFQNVFPGLFHLTSVLSIISISSGFKCHIQYLSGEISQFSKYALGIIDPYCMCLSDYSAHFHICVENRLEPNSAFMNYETNEADVKKDAKFFGYETRACLLVLILIFILLMCAARGVEDKNMSDQSPDGESSKKSHYPYKGHA